MGPRIPCTSLRISPPQYEDDNIWSSDDSTENDSTENENENRSSYMLFPPTLEDLKNDLYVALNPYFEEFEIEVVSCPCLIKAPYNLAAAGLSGNTGILTVGDFNYFYPRPRTDFAFDIQDILSRCSYDAFVIGSGFATRPILPYNGHLTMNAIVSANPTNVFNNSCISYQSANWIKLRTINDRDQIKCCLFGQFFFSGGKRGPVIKIRAKGRRSRSNIIALIQLALANRCRCQPLIGLGIVLVINGGETVQLNLPRNFVYRYNRNNYYYGRLNLIKSMCENLIVLGALISESLQILKWNNKWYFRNKYSMFNAFCNNSRGEFWNDMTPEETEYIVYINIAQEKCCNF